MAGLGLEKAIVDRAVYQRTVQRFRDAKIVLPTFAELAEPDKIPAKIAASLSDVDPDAPDSRNLFRVHWYNDSDRRSRAQIPNYVVIPEALSGVPSPILVAYGNRFPMIHAHKVLASYACLVPRLVTGQFDPTSHRAVWPSTGNYCRGGAAISRILDCRAVAVLPEGMSEERFSWLAKWVANPSEDIIRTFGVESNVKEIYDKCAELEADPDNIIFNQFCEFGNHLAHYQSTGKALAHIFATEKAAHPELALAAFVSATGSAGTIAAGDYLKDEFGTRIVAAEALECPTMLYNGFGEHNIQGIGDKHIPFIHNVMNTDMAVAISDTSTDALNVLFNTDVGKQLMVDKVGAELVTELANFGLSSICNVLSAIKTAKQWQLGPNDAIVTIATDGAAMYETEVDKAVARLFPGGFDARVAERVFREELEEVGTDNLLDMTPADRNRVFNLGYFTWVEQQGVSFEEFEVRRGQEFWRGLRPLLPAWDTMIDEFNHETGVIDSL